MWKFGPPKDVVYRAEPDEVQGVIYHRQDRPNTTFLLSIREEHAPERKFSMGPRDFDFTTGFDGLHTRVYEETLAGNGFGIEDARAAVRLCHEMRQ